MPPPADPLSLTPAGWETVADSWKEPRYRGRQIFDALQRRGVTESASMRELPGALRGRLEAEMPLLLPQVVRRDVAADGSAKYGLRLSDGALIEAVLMPGESRTAAVNEFEDARQISNFEFRNSNLPKLGASNSKFEIRNSKFTICLSSQTGCAVDCAFCVTGRLGGGRNLSAGEILGQLRAVMADAGLGWEGLRV